VRGSRKSPGAMPGGRRGVCVASGPEVASLVLVLALGFSLALSSPSSLAGQSPTTLSVSFAGDEGGTLPLASHRGYPSLPAVSLLPLGWQAEDRGAEVLLRHRTGIQLAFVPGSPFLAWDGDLFQMTEAAYRFDGQLHVPLQLVVDLFPGLLPRAYEWDRERRILRVAERPSGPFPDPPTSSPVAENSSPPAPASPAPRTRAPRVVVIDPGHGGDDPGAIGPGGTREKDVALAVGLALARLLGEDPEVEVRLTRDRDLLVPIWERGERATEWKGDRPGVFVSIHANALPGRPGVRGFETYFLSEARTEHERRVAAAENAPLYQGREEDRPPPSQDPLLAGILRDLRTFDHQHWSALFAELVQRELGTFHPGPDRGVKQGPFAVITNALMPSVLVEVGFITNREEERLLARPEFHRDTAEALARAIRDFFQRYPAGSGS
jgi:N-acetylmuramoyl-L-alanine amidase